MTGEDDQGKRRPPGGFERPRRPFDGRGLAPPPARLGRQVVFAWHPRSCRVGHVTQVRPAHPPSMPALSPGDRLGRGASPRRLQGAPATEEGVKPGAAGGPPGTSWLERSEVSGEGGRGGQAVRRRQGLSPEFRSARTALASPSQGSIHSPFGSDRLGLVSVVFFKTIPTTIKR